MFDPPAPRMCTCRKSHMTSLYINTIVKVKRASYTLTIDDRQSEIYRNYSYERFSLVLFISNVRWYRKHIQTKTIILKSEIFSIRSYYFHFMKSRYPNENFFFKFTHSITSNHVIRYEYLLRTPEKNISLNWFLALHMTNHASKYMPQPFDPPIYC